jgi:TetR/AcrR family transcriptional regulator, mexJK operon transcriptional repressor
MARPAKHRSTPPRSSKRERVITAASKLFLERGYGEAGMDAIAEEAGVSKATLYSYYDDKASLFADVMARVCEELGGPPQLESLAGESPEASLRIIAMHGLHKILETVDRRILRRVLAESGEFPELGRKFWENGPGKLEVHLTRYLADAKRRHLLEVPDPARAAARLAGQITGLYLLPRLLGVRGRPSDAELCRDVDDLIAGFVTSLRKTERPGRSTRTNP